MGNVLPLEYNTPPQRAPARGAAPRQTSPAVTMITIPSLNSPILCEDYFDTYLVEAGYDCAVYLFAGDVRVEYGKRGDCGEHDFANFGVICNYNALACSFEHRAFGSGFVEIKFGQPVFDGDTSHADKGFVYLEAA